MITELGGSAPLDMAALLCRCWWVARPVQGSRGLVTSPARLNPLAPTYSRCGIESVLTPLATYIIRSALLRSEIYIKEFLVVQQLYMSSWFNCVCVCGYVPSCPHMNSQVHT